jgi:hypothetical protein
MRFVFGFAAAAMLSLFCSCDKHHVGELPEVQKEHVDLADKPNESAERSTSSAESEKSPTPAEFFTPAKSP